MTTSDLTARPKTSAGRGKRARGDEDEGLGPGSFISGHLPWGGSLIHMGCQPPGPICKGRGLRPAQSACLSPGGQGLGCIYSSGCQSLLWPSHPTVDPGRGLKFWVGRHPLLGRNHTAPQEACHPSLPSSWHKLPHLERLTEEHPSARGQRGCVGNGAPYP